MIVMASYIRVCPGPSPLTRSYDSARFDGQRCSLAVKQGILSRFEGHCLNIGNNPGIYLTTWTADGILSGYPLTRRDYLQRFLGPAEGFLFEIQSAEWTLSGEKAVFNFRLQYSSRADLQRVREYGEIVWQAVEANLRAYIMYPIPAELKDQARLTIEMNGSIVEGRLTIPN